MHTDELRTIAEGLQQAGIDIPGLGPDVPRFIVYLWRRLSEGKPLSPAQVNQALANLRLSQEVLQQVRAGLEFDDAGNLVGAVGLSLHQTANRFQVNGQTLFTWCAWDALFIPTFLGQVVEVETVCPVTQQPIKFSVTPERVESYEPLTAVISVVVPGTGMVSQAQSAQEVWASFCNHVHFFSSADAARAWFSGKRYEPVLLSLEDGYQLGQLRFAEMRGHLEKADANVKSAVINAGR